MAWISKTDQFTEEEMYCLENASGPELLPILFASDPIYVLRALAELQLNDELERLEFLKAQQDLMDYCRKWVEADNEDVKVCDQVYAKDLGLEVVHA